MDTTLRSDIDVLAGLNALSSRLWQSRDLRVGLTETLVATISLLNADKGMILLRVSDDGPSKIIASSGYDEPVLELFRRLNAVHETAIGRALKSRERVIIPDVDLDASFAPFLDAAHTMGFRAVQATPLIARDGNVLGLLCTHFRMPHRPSEQSLRQLDLYARLAADFIERLRIDDALRESEDRFRRFMHYLPGLAWIKDGEGRYLFANDAAVRAFGTPRERLIGRTDDDVFPPETAAQFRSHDRRALTSDAGLQVIETLEQSDGVHHSIVSKFSMPGADGGAPYVGGIAVDITEHKRAENELARSEERFRALAENPAVLIWVNGLHGCEFVNSTYRDFLGAGDRDLMGYGWAQFVHPDDRDACLATYARAMAKRVSFEVEFRFRRHDGEYRWIRSAGHPRYAADGLFLGYAGSSLDITEHKRAEDELKEADRRKDQFLATLAHELRNPLAPLRNGLEVMKLARGNAQAMDEVRTMMERQLGQMNRLIDDLLDVSRISRGRVALRTERLELADIVRQAVEAIRPAIEQARHTLTIDVPEKAIYVDGDATRLAQVFSNLLSNAAKFTATGGHVWLTVTREGEKAVLRVRDNGIGIPPDMLRRIFETFTQVDWSLERAQGGLGIGLSLVKGLVEMHGGSVEARSAGYEQGTEFIVRLPVAANATFDAPSLMSPPTTHGPRRRILVADDNRDAARSLAMILEMQGNETRVVHDGAEALDAARAFKPHAMLLDIGMPKMNGYDVARRVRMEEWGKSIAIFAVTGWGQDEIRRRSQEAGFDHHLVKPVEPDALFALLRGMERKSALL